MTDNRTTELLREGLTEYGIEWRSGLEGVTFVGDWCFVEYDNGKIAATCEPVLTPEQAIAATLGSGTCELHDCDGSFSAVNRPVWRCDCGAFMTQYTDATTYHKPRFCPNCGRKVVSA